MNSEISLEIGLIAARRFEAAPGHEEKDHGTMDFVPAAKVNRRLILGGMETTLVVKLHVEFELWSELVADDEAGEPGVRSLMHKLITDFIVHFDGPKLSGKFERQQEALARRRDPAAYRVVRIVQKSLRENRDVESRLPGIIETPLKARIRLTQAIFSRGFGVFHAQPRIFVSQLDAIAHPKVNIDVRRMRNGLIAVKKWHVTEIDFPVEMPRSAGIIGVIRRAALGECCGSRKEKRERED